MQYKGPKHKTTGRPRHFSRTSSESSPDVGPAGRQCPCQCPCSRLGPCAVALCCSRQAMQAQEATGLRLQGAHRVTEGHGCRQPQLRQNGAAPGGWYSCWQLAPPDTCAHAAKKHRALCTHIRPLPLSACTHTHTHISISIIFFTQTEGVVLDIHDLHRQAFNAAFHNMGYDCIQWAPHVYHDLLRAGAASVPRGKASHSLLYPHSPLTQWTSHAYPLTHAHPSHYLPHCRR